MPNRLTDNLRSLLTVAIFCGLIAAFFVSIPAYITMLDDRILDNNYSIAGVDR